MTKEELVADWSSAIDSGSFLTAKHDPSGLGIAFAKFRTVLSTDAASSLGNYIKSGSYGVRVFSDTRHSGQSGLFEIVPSGSYPFSVAGSGVQSGSLLPSGSYDRLVVAHSNTFGWHVFAENEAVISSSVVNGRLTLQRQF